MTQSNHQKKKKCISVTPMTFPTKQDVKKNKKLIKTGSSS